jgi:hypothetical protein
VRPAHGEEISPAHDGSVPARIAMVHRAVCA